MHACMRAGVCCRGVQRASVTTTAHPTCDAGKECHNINSQLTKKPTSVATYIPRGILGPPIEALGSLPAIGRGVVSGTSPPAEGNEQLGL